MGKKRDFLLFTACCLLLTLFLIGCGNWNIFSWTHKAGTSKDPVVLIADGETALEQGKYDDAIAYFTEVLEQPGQENNSEALYGRAQAEMGELKDDVVDIITSMIEGEELELLNPEGLIDDLAKLADISEKVVADLRLIADGHADGTIPATNVDVNVNLAIMEVLQASTRILDLNNDGIYGGEGDVVQVSEDYTVTFHTEDLENMSDADKEVAKQQIIESIIDLVGAEEAGKIVGNIPAERQGDQGAVQHMATAMDEAGLTEELGIDLEEMEESLNDLVDDDNPETEDDLAGLWNALQGGG